MDNYLDPDNEAYSALRKQYAEDFRLTTKQARNLTHALLDQLKACKSDEARRLIMSWHTSNQSR